MPNITNTFDLHAVKVEIEDNATKIRGISQRDQELMWQVFIHSRTALADYENSIDMWAATLDADLKEQLSIHHRVLIRLMDKPHITAEKEYKKIDPETGEVMVDPKTGKDLTEIRTVTITPEFAIREIPWGHLRVVAQQGEISTEDFQKLMKESVSSTREKVRAEATKITGGAKFKFEVRLVGGKKWGFFFEEGTPMHQIEKFKAYLAKYGEEV